MDEQDVRRIIREELSDLFKSGRYTFTKDLELFEGRNIKVGNDTGTKIGTSASQKLGFFGKTPKVQVPTASVPSTAAGIIITLKDFGFYEA